MHKSSHFFAHRSKSVTCACSDDYVKSFCRCKVVADRAYTAETLYKHRHFPVWTSLYKFFESAEFDDMKP